MAKCIRVAVLLSAALASLGASYRTQNFVVDAATPQIAQQVGQLAEQYRREKAIEWLGTEMPPWPQPCPIQVKVTMGGAGGATSFAFDNGRVLGQHMTIEGALDRLLASVLPHEVTHTVFAHYFRTPVPRWADEGGAVLSEDDIEKNRHDHLVRQILNTPGRAMPLRRLFGLRDYPGDVMTLYAQGFSVSQFLVSQSSRPAFLNFVAHGMQHGWDSAVQVHFRYHNIEELEQAWLAHLRATRRQPPSTLLAQNTSPQALPPVQPVSRPTAPSTPRLIYRGQSPGPEIADADPTPRRQLGSPYYLPDYDPSQARTNPTYAPAPPHSPDTWQPQGTNPSPNVRLGAPQFAPAAPSGRVGAMVGYPQ
jgi:hypothetical protein